MKKIIAFILILTMALSFVACSGQGDDGKNNENTPAPCKHEIKYTVNEQNDGYTLTAVKNCTCESIVLPETYEGLPVIAIGDGAFMGCKTLKSITLPESVTQIWHRAFAGCTGLESVNIPSGVTGMGFYVFAGCTSLKSVTIPASVTYVGGDIFRSCGNVTVNCEADSQPAEWESTWNKSGCTVIWGRK